MNQDETIIRCSNSIEEQYNKDIDFDLMSIIRHHLQLAYGAGYDEGKRKKDKMKPVMQMKNGALIETYDSVIDAHRCTKIDKTLIARAARGVMKTAGGYNWKYKTK